MMMSLPKTLAEYAEVYLADLLLPLSNTDQKHLLDALAIGYMGGPFPSRILVQRLVEATAGSITGEQYRSWVLRDYEGDASCVAHVLSSLRSGVLVGGTREVMLTYLANADVSEHDLTLLSKAGADGLLSEQEILDIVKHALALPLLPDLIVLPEGLQPLPPDYPEPRRESPMSIDPW